MFTSSMELLVCSDFDDHLQQRTRFQQHSHGCSLQRKTDITCTVTTDKLLSTAKYVTLTMR